MDDMIANQVVDALTDIAVELRRVAVALELLEGVNAHLHQIDEALTSGVPWRVVLTDDNGSPA